MDHYFHGMLGDAHIHKDIGYTLNHCSGVFLPKAFPHAHLNDWHLAPPTIVLSVLRNC